MGPNDEGLRRADQLVERLLAELYPEPGAALRRKAELEAQEVLGQPETLEALEILTQGLIARLGRSLLRLLACLADHDVPYQRLLDPAILADSALFVGLDVVGLSRILQMLADASLVELVEPGSGTDGDTDSPPTLRIRRDVRDATHRVDSTDDHAAYLRLAVSLLDRAAHSGDPEDPKAWSWWRMLAPHCAFVLRATTDSPAIDVPADAASRAAAAAHQAACYLHARGLYKQAESEFQAVLNVRRQLTGDSAAAILVTRRWLACAIRDGDPGRLPEAERELRAVYEEQRELLGHTRPDPSGVLGQLARVGWDSPAGLALLERDWEINVARPLLDMTETYQQLAITLAYRASSAGREYEAAAKKAYQAVYEARRRILPDNHPDILETRHGLAIRLRNEGRLEDAIREFRAVYNTERQLPERGADHPSTLLTGSLLGDALKARGDLAEAEAVYREVYLGHSRILGHDHPDAMADRCNLAGVLRDSGQITAAAHEYRGVLIEHRAVFDTQRRTLGDHHPSTSITRRALAGVLVSCGRLVAQIASSPSLERPFDLEDQLGQLVAEIAASPSHRSPAGLDNQMGSGTSAPSPHLLGKEQTTRSQILTMWLSPRSPYTFIDGPNDRLETAKNEYPASFSDDRSALITPDDLMDMVLAGSGLRAGETAINQLLDRKEASI